MAVHQNQHRRFERGDMVEFIREAINVHVDSDLIAPRVMYLENPTEGLIVENGYGRWTIKVEQARQQQHA